MWHYDGFYTSVGKAMGLIWFVRLLFSFPFFSLILICLFHNIFIGFFKHSHLKHASHAAGTLTNRLKVLSNGRRKLEVPLRNVVQVVRSLKGHFVLT